MIGFSGTIGSGLYLGTGDILHTAGPMGAILAFLLVGCLAVTVMLCISEMICLWPISNALVKFPETFVDKDLGIIVGIAYWSVVLRALCENSMLTWCQGIPMA